VGASPDIVWSALEGDDQIPVFLDAVSTLYRGVLDRLPAEDRPFFFDYWLRAFNSASTHLATVDGVPHALVTQPFRPGTHEFRWETATLACSDELHGRLVLPPGVDSGQSFRMSALDTADKVSSPFPGLQGRENQRGYARSLTDFSLENEADAPWSIRRVRREDFEEAIDLLRRSEVSDEDPDPDLSESREELRQTIENDAGWCWVASRTGESDLCGIVCYAAMHLPDAGVPAVLISDIAVAPEHRRQGLAQFMQRRGFACLRDLGLRWVFGCIEPDNHASCGQAERLGRTLWFRCVRFQNFDDESSREQP
jgi:ribosomal protein S18 acetylase RimI-like enzyme